MRRLRRFLALGQEVIRQRRLVERRNERLQLRLVGGGRFGGQGDLAGRVVLAAPDFLGGQLESGRLAVAGLSSLAVASMAAVSAGLHAIRLYLRVGFGWLCLRWPLVPNSERASDCFVSHFTHWRSA